ncbi:hypothetical protein IWW34DRAFT_803553 [Fusarium oxysporum f. sp. albedinis]|nr:hypothetical protein IWW34DRAFT_803553 [Fusarium oxysporum f. sp. albedinis]
MDVFKRLSPELIAPILSSLPDLKSLYNIVKASPYVFHFFNSPHGAAILDDLLGSWGQAIEDKDVYVRDMEGEEGSMKCREHGALPWVPLFLRLVALIRHCTSTNQPADSFECLFLKYFMPKNNDNGHEFVHDLQLPPDNIPRIRLEDVIDGPQSFSPREMLILIRKIKVLSEECFQFFYGRMQATTPQHLVDKSFDLGPLPWNYRHYGQPWGEPYELDAGPAPSRWEMQGLIFGFCNLQLRYELSTAIHEGRLDWSASDAEAIRDLGSAEKCSPELGSWTLLKSWESVWSAVLYVRYLEGVPDESSFVGNTDGENRRILFNDTGFRPLTGGRLRLPQPKYETSDFEWPTTTSRQPLLPPFDNFFAINCRFVIGVNGGLCAQDIFSFESTSELTAGLLFRPFRRLGFGIWDNPRHEPGKR